MLNMSNNQILMIFKFHQYFDYLCHKIYIILNSVNTFIKRFRKRMQFLYLISEHYELRFLSLPQSPSLPKALQLSWQVQLDESLVFLLTRFMYKMNFHHLIHEPKRRTKRHFTDSLPQRRRFHEHSGLRLCSLVNGPKQPFWVFVKRHIHVVKMGQTGGDLC